MSRALIYSDSHEAEDSSYSDLALAARLEGVSEAGYLGDTDYARNMRRQRRFHNDLARAGIKGFYLRGNHEQGWLDYGIGLDERCIVDNLIDESVRHDTGLVRFLNGLPSGRRMGKVHLSHTFPVGKAESGPPWSDVPERDPRMLYRRLWHYSFGTRETTGEGMTAYDPEVIALNLQWLASSGLKFMVNGHEHLPKVWFIADGSIHGGEILAPGTAVTLRYPSIVHLGDFQNGHYAILEPEDGVLRVEFRQI